MRYKRKSDGLEAEMQQISSFGFRYAVEKDGYIITSYIDKNKLDMEWEKIKDDNVIRRE